MPDVVDNKFPQATQSSSPQADNSEPASADPSKKSSSALYTFSARVRYSETDQEGFMTLPALINIFQDCSTFQSNAVGFGPKYLKSRHSAWVLTHWHIVVDRYPELGEMVEVGTFASGFKTVSAKRNFTLYDENKKLIAKANSTWGFVDLLRGKPIRPEPEHVSAYHLAEPLEMPAENRKVAIPADYEEAEPISIKREHIDSNQHVNNSRYVMMALDVLPQELRPKCIRVDYRRSAVLGDVIYPHVSLEPDRSLVVLTDSEGGIFGAVELQ